MINSDVMRCDGSGREMRELRVVSKRHGRVAASCTRVAPHMSESGSDDAEDGSSTQWMGEAGAAKAMGRAASAAVQ